MNPSAVPNMPTKYPVIMPTLAPIHPPKEPKTVALSSEMNLVFKMVFLSFSPT